LTNSATVRSLFGRIGVFLFLSSLADLYFSYPGMNLNSGDWYDLVWSSLLLLPIAIADGWKEADRSNTPSAPAQMRDSLGRYMSPLIYSLLVFIMCVQIAREHLAVASLFVLTSFLCSSARMFIVQRQQERSEGELRRREAQYRKLIENIPEVLWTADENGNFLFVSERITSVFGYTPEEICSEGERLWFGRTCARLTPNCSRRIEPLTSHTECSIATAAGCTGTTAPWPPSAGRADDTPTACFPTSASGGGSKSSFGKRKRWRLSASWRAAWRMISTTSLW
jgi:PAS domain-containing protein